MDVYKEDILDLCKQFLKLSKELYDQKKITDEEYVKMTRLKTYYLENYNKKR